MDRETVMSWLEGLAEPDWRECYSDSEVQETARQALDFIDELLKDRKDGEVSMGCIDTITAYKFPKQSEYVNRRCKVCFHYNTTKWIMGTVIRDDREEPYETLIKLDDGRVMRAVECQYSFSI